MSGNRERGENNAFDSLDFGTNSFSPTSNKAFSSSALNLSQPHVNNKPAINTYHGHLIPNSNYSQNTNRNQQDAPVSPDERFRPGRLI